MGLFGRCSKRPTSPTPALPEGGRENDGAKASPRWGSFCLVRPARTYSNGCESPSRPNSGKATAESKGVHREVESEGSLRQTSDPTYRNLIPRLWEWISLLTKTKSHNCSETLGVNQAGIRWKEYVHNWGGLKGESARISSNNEP